MVAESEMCFFQVNFNMAGKGATQNFGNKCRIK